ncbi:PAS domain S-box protein [Halosolutus gelatinilyticus]|uniref:PAS domain S-box protein n=1 Tax=Halosolutus gelatinilyticus TaxID=2931975 RepID=UPI001FF211FB|nr:PAS domain S-box protein [Halosolutus gelatinilyticus]
MDAHAEEDAELRARIRQQEVVADLGHRALETDDLDRLFQEAVAAVAETLDNEYATVLELRPGGDEAFLRQGVGWQDGLVGSATVAIDRDSQAGYTLLSEQPVIVDDLRSEDRFSGSDLLVDHDVGSGISVIIGSVEEPWGILGTHTADRREFDEHDANFVQSVANVLASAIENERTQRELEENNRALQRLYEVTADQDRSFDEKVSRVLELGRERLGVETGYLAVVDEEEDHFQITHASSDDSRVQPGSVTPLSETYCQTTIDIDGLLAFTERPPDEKIDEAVYGEWDLDCYIGGSVIAEGDLYGTLCFEDRALQRTPFTPGEQTFVELATQWVSYELERTRRRRALEQYKEYTDNTLDAVDDVFYALGSDGTLERWNESVSEITGYVDEEIASMHALDFFDETDREVIASAIVEGFETGQVRVEAKIRTKNGGSIPYEFIAASLENPDGERVLAGIGRDITERKAHERELTKYETIVETINDGIYVKDEEARFTMVNNAYAALTGYDRDDLVGKPASLVVDEDTIARSREILATPADEDEDRPTMEAEVQTADGDRVPVEGTFATLQTDDREQREVGVVRDITDRKRRERERRRVIRALEAAREGISLLDASGEFIYVNDAYADTFRYDPDEMVGKHWDDLGIESNPSRFYDDILPRLADEGQWSGTTTCVRSDGSTFPSQHSLTYTEDGELICLVRDITEQRKRKRRLRETRAQLDMATKAASVGLWTWDIRDDVVTADEYLAESHGIDPAEAAAGVPMDAFYESILAGDRERTWTRLERAVEETGELNAEYRVRNEDGGLMWMIARGEIEYDDAGEPIRINGAVSDITQRKRRERQLEKSERRYRTLAENFPNGAVGMYDHDLRFTLTEGRALGDTLPSADQLEGDRIPALLRSDTAADLEALFRAAIEDGEMNSTTTEFCGRHWRVWAAPLRDATDEIFAGLSFAQDITERVEYERRLEELITRLGESNERLEQFAYAASHDMQEPLRMVSSYLQLIEHRYADELDEDGEEFLEFAVNGAERMREMIEGLLAYSRVETQGDPFKPADLEEVLDDVTEDLSMRIEESDAAIETESLPRVRGDAGQLRQVFQNLLINAIEYSGDDPPRVRVSAEREGETWVVSVRDEGIGIEPASQDRIFEVFQRLHSRDEHAGTGIGLALCQRIVERHGGEIHVDSAPGEGATFSFTLPSVNDR